MLSLLATGLLLGFWAGVAPGPMLALVVSETLRHGVRAGVQVALAPLLSDLPVVVASLWLVGELANYTPAFGLLACFGALLVGWLGWRSLRSHGADLDVDSAATGSLRRAVMVNLFNPHPALFWFAIGAPLTIGGLQHGIQGAALFVASFYLLLVGSKVALAWLVGRSRQLLRGGGYIFAMRALGALLIGFALLLLRDGLGLLGVLPAT